MARVFTDKDLYQGGRPRSSDIDQDNIGNCFFVATAGAIADQQPELIRIAYDAKTQEFTTSLFKDGKRVEYSVTQSELREDMRRGGASTYDNRRSGPIWPAVLEVAYAKSLDSDLTDGLAEGWKKMDQGGRAIDAMTALTGSKGDSIDRPKAYRLGTQETLRQLSAALAQGRPITLNTQNELGLRKDGLANYHTYVVQGAYIDAKGDARLTLRNPQGTNINNRERLEKPSVKLDDLIRTGGLAYFNLGPKPAMQEQSAEPVSAIRTPAQKVQQVVDLLNDMVSNLGTPRPNVALTQTMQALRDSPAGKEFSVQGSVQIERTSVQMQSDVVRVTPRQSEAQTQRIGRM